MIRAIRTAPRLHPLVAAAAASVIVVSATGVAALTGLLPTSKAPAVATAQLAAPAAVSPAPVALPTPMAAPDVAAAPAPIATPKLVAAPKPKPVRVARQVSYEEPQIDRHVVMPAVGHDLPPSRPYDSSPYGSGAYGSNNAYGNAPLPAPLPPVVQARPACANCGVVEAIAEINKPGEGSGIGLAGGALGGAVVGKQFGKGHGQDFLTILGAVGGAYAGHQVEKSVRSTKSYEVRVRMEDGSVRSVTQTTPPGWRNGDKVRVDGGAISGNMS